MESGIPKNTPVEISRGYVEISRGRVLKSAGGMSKSAMPPCRNQQHIDNRNNRHLKTIGNTRQKETIGARVITITLKRPDGRSVQLHKQIARSFRTSLAFFSSAISAGVFSASGCGHGFSEYPLFLPFVFR